MTPAPWASGATEDDRARGYIDPETGILATFSRQPLRTPDELRAYEDDYVEFRMLDVELDPVEGDFDLVHLCAIARQWRR